MSADNGIYILKTLNPKIEEGFEYRVQHLQAIDNVDWDGIKGCETNNQDVRIKNAREMWDPLPVYHNQEDAFIRATEIEDDISWTEYGICTIYIPRQY